MTKIRPIFLISLLFFTCLIDVRLSEEDAGPKGDSPSEGETDVNLQASKPGAKAAKGGAKARAKADGDDEGHEGKDGKGLLSSDELQKRYDKVKNNKGSGGLKGKSGKLMQIVIQAIKDINPVRLIMEFDLDVFLSVQGINVEKFQIPVDYFSDQFFNKFAAKTKWSKKDLSKEFKVDIEAKKPGTWFSLGTMLKAGKKKDLRLGDYLDFLGLDVTPYEKKYDDFLVETVRVPVEFLDELMTDGFGHYIQALQSYVNQNGGPMNAALKAYSEYTGTDVVAATQQALKKMKTMDVSKSKGEYNKQWALYKNETIKQFRHYYKDWYGKGGRIYVYQKRVSQAINDYFKFMASLYKGDRLNALLNLVGNAIGPEGRAITYIVYQPTTVMFNQIFGPLFLIPRIMGSEEELWDKILALPPVIIQTSGGKFKPFLMVFEPLIRLGRFLITGEYTKSMSAGLDIAAAHGISIWGGAFKPKKMGKAKPAAGGATTPAPAGEEEPEQRAKAPAKGAPKRAKRQAPAKKGVAKRAGGADDGAGEKAPRYSKSDKKLADTYQGGPPPGGYKLGVKNDGKVDLDDEDMISRILLSPDFILKAGGPVFVPFASVLAPLLRAVNTIAFGKADFNSRVAEVPPILRGVGFVGPLADVVQSLLPFIKMIYLAQMGKLTNTEIVIQTPSLVKEATNGVLYNVYKHPEKLWGAMSQFFAGPGGVLAMLRMQADLDPPTTDPGAMVDAKEDLGAEGNFIVKTFGEFFGGWFLGYLQALGPVGSLNGGLFNGILANIINPVKFLDTNVNLKSQPLKNLIEAFDDLPRMLKASEDKKAFLTAVLGGQDPDILKEIGIDVEKMTEAGVDPGKFLAGGKHVLPPEEQKKLGDGSGVGINPSQLSKVGLDQKKLIDSGLLDANDEKLHEMGIDFGSIINRVLRGSVEDDVMLINAGINAKIMLKAGLCPAQLLAGGVGSLPDEKVKELGIKNPKAMTDEELMKIGLNPNKLHAKGVLGKKLAAEGIESFVSVQKNLGIDVHKLMTSMYTGLEHKRMAKAGIDLKVMVRAGIDTKLVLTGGLRKAAKNDISEPSLAKIGIDLRKVVAIGININLLVDVGGAVLNPMNLVKLGIDPMRALIGTLSRHGLDQMTGGLDDATSVSFGFINSILRILNNAVGLIPKIRELPGGKSIINEQGKFIGAAGFIMYKIIGIENHGGLLGLFQKIYSGKFTRAEILALINPIRITNEAANPEKKPAVMRRTKSQDVRRTVDEYAQKSVNLRVGKQEAPKSNLFGLGGKAEKKEKEER